MKLRFFLLIILIFIVSCSGNDYNNDDVVAILNEEEILIEDILWQYSLDEDLEYVIETYLKQEVIKKEAESMGITVTEDEVQKMMLLAPADLTVEERMELSGNSAYAKRQASLLKISPEEYYENWEYTTAENQVYLDKYVAEKISEIKSINIKEVYEHTFKNAINLFKISKISFV